MLTYLSEKIEDVISRRDYRKLVTVRNPVDKIIAIRMPVANAELSLSVIKLLTDIVEKCHYLCFFSFDPSYLGAGEIGLELFPGCQWWEVESFLTFN